MSPTEAIYAPLDAFAIGPTEPESMCTAGRFTIVCSFQSVFNKVKADSYVAQLTGSERSSTSN